MTESPEGPDRVASLLVSHMHHACDQIERGRYADQIDRYCLIAAELDRVYTLAGYGDIWRDSGRARP